MSHPLQLALKRLFDILVAGAGLIISAPLVALVALVIKLDDRGPVLFIQERVGQEGRPFRCLKFRTMITGAQALGRGLEVSKDDERITRAGRFLRTTSLDELPQLWNVLVGDMSLVGPRPTVASQVARYTPRQRRRLAAKPGLAGWAWIHGRNRLPWSERIELDLWYIDHYSFLLDLYILVKTAGLILRREGIYADDGIAHDLDEAAPR